MGAREVAATGDFQPEEVEAVQTPAAHAHFLERGEDRRGREEGQTSPEMSSGVTLSGVAANVKRICAAPTEFVRRSRRAAPRCRRRARRPAPPALRTGWPPFPPS